MLRHTACQTRINEETQEFDSHQSHAFQNYDNLKRTHPSTSCEFFVIDQITCLLNFLEEFHLLFQMQKESRRYQSINYDPQLIRKFGEFLDFRNHILI